jgi:ankyrin repeat protein
VNLLRDGLTSALIAAAKADDAKVVQYLIEHGAHINITHEHGWTPYIHAVASKCWNAARALLDAGSAIRALRELIALVPSKLVELDGKSVVGVIKDGLKIRRGKNDNSCLSETTLLYSSNLDAVEEAQSTSHILLRADRPIVPTLPFYSEMRISSFGVSDG